MEKLFDMLESIFFTKIFGQIDLYTILSGAIKFVFILIVLVFVSRIVRMISLDIKSSYRKAPINAPRLKLLNSVDEFDFPIREEYFLSNNNTIGRADDNNIIIKSKMISKHQAVIVNSGGRFFIEDLSSTNPTMVNENPITMPTEIFANDVISMATLDFLFIEGEDNE